VEELHSVIEVIHEEDGQSETKIIVMGDWNIVDG
jgi:exonuclease III